MGERGSFVALTENVVDRWRAFETLGTLLERCTILKETEMRGEGQPIYGGLSSPCTTLVRPKAIDELLSLP